MEGGGGGGVEGHALTMWWREAKGSSSAVDAATEQTACALRWECGRESAGFKTVTSTVKVGAKGSQPKHVHGTTPRSIRTRMQSLLIREHPATSHINSCFSTHTSVALVISLISPRSEADHNYIHSCRRDSLARLTPISLCTLQVISEVLERGIKV